MTRKELTEFIMKQRESKWNFFIMKDLLELHLSTKDFLYSINLLLPHNYKVDTLFNECEKRKIKKPIKNSFILYKKVKGYFVEIDRESDRFYLITELILEYAFENDMYYL